MRSQTVLVTTSTSTIDDALLQESPQVGLCGHAMLTSALNGSIAGGGESLFDQVGTALEQKAVVVEQGLLGYQAIKEGVESVRLAKLKFEKVFSR